MGRSEIADLSANHRLVLLLLNHLSGQRLGAGTLAGLSGLNNKTVNRLCQGLERLGVVRVRRRRGRENLIEKGPHFSTAWAKLFRVPMPAWSPNAHVVDNGLDSSAQPEPPIDDYQNNQVAQRPGFNVTYEVRTSNVNPLQLSENGGGNGTATQLQKTRLIRALCDKLGQKDIGHWREVADRFHPQLILRALAATEKKKATGTVQNPGAYFWRVLQRMEEEGG
jgi:DNA-binding MarR family transcriptional regulator